MTGPLDGFRVIDLTTIVLGPIAGQRLGDLGADVVKIESPAGDPCRALGVSRSRGMGAVFLNLNRNKRSVALDLKRPAARAALLRLVAGADVFIHNMRPKAAHRLGLDYPTLAKANPALIYGAAYGFRAGGPYGDKPAYDDMIQAASGLAANQGGGDGPPTYMKSMVADKIVGLELAQAVIAALLHRARAGVGQFVETPMFETMAAFMSAEHLNGKLFDPPAGPTGYSRVHSKYRKPYATRDGWIGCVPYNDKQWRALFALVDAEHLNDDPRFGTFEGRLAHIDAVYAWLERTLATRTTAEWIAALDAAQIPAMPVTTIDALLEDPHLDAVGFWRKMEHPSEGALWMADFPWRFSESPAAIRRLAPRLGEHSAEVLGEAGLSAEEIAAATATAAAGAPQPA